MGAPYDLYSLNDIDRIDPEQYKLFIFLDAIYLTKEQRDYINQTLKRDGRGLLFSALAIMQMMTDFRLSGSASWRK